MADPVLSNGIRVQCAFQGRSGLPEDRFVTTWAFATANGAQASLGQLDTACGLIAEFWQVPVGTAGTRLDARLGSSVAATGHVAKGYALWQLPTQRVPFIRTLASRPLTGGSLPSEVALCASFYAVINRPRNRGRIYLGPLSSGSTIATEDGSGVSRPSAALIQQLLAGMVRLKSSAETAGLRWCVLSQADSALKIITGGWVDNAFDTQRRRGEEANARSEWGGVGAG